MRLNWAGCLRGRYTRLAMSPLLLPLRLVVLVVAGWVNRHQLDVIEYLQEENRVRATRTRGSTLPRSPAANRAGVSKFAHENMIDKG